MPLKQKIKLIYTMALSVNERQNWLKLHDWAWLEAGIWKICENCCWTVSCVHTPQQYQSCIDFTDRLAVSKIARGQVVHRLNYTFGGQTWMRNGTSMTFSNPLLCHSWRRIRTPSSGTNARPHRARVVYQFLEEHNIERMDHWPAHSPDMNPNEAMWDQLGKAVNGRIRRGDTL